MTESLSVSSRLGRNTWQNRAAGGGTGWRARTIMIALGMALMLTLALACPASAHVASDYEPGSHMGCAFAGQSAMGFDTAHRAFAWTADGACAGYLELWVQMPRLSGPIYNFYNGWVVSPPDYYDEHPPSPHLEPHNDVWVVLGRHRISISGPDVSSSVHTLVGHQH